MWKILVVLTYVFLGGEAEFEHKTEHFWSGKSFLTEEVCMDQGTMDVDDLVMYRFPSKDYEIQVNLVKCVYFDHLPRPNNR